MRLTPNGHLLVGTTTDNGNNVEINGSIYDTAGYYTNSSALLGGSNPSGALRLRGSPADGSYIGFYDQGDTKLKTYIGSFGDNRPIVIEDSAGVSFYTSPYVSIGSETGVTSKLSVVNPFGSGLYDLGLARILSDGSRVYDVAVMPPGLVQLGTFTDNGMKMQVDGAGAFAGKVGIGTLVPSAQLHTTGTVCFAGLTLDNTQTRILVSDTNGNLFYRTASSLAANDLPRSSLAVNGTITAKQLKLRPEDWPDYVFESSYRLPSLPAIETYIRERHHLPGIPSAKEVEKGGADIGANQAAMLKKIEELTLYSIAQEKALEEQNKKLETQGKSIDALQEQLVELRQLVQNKPGK